MNNLQELKNEIQKAVPEIPEILELKEGCLLWNTYQTPDIGCGYNFVRQQGESMLVRTPQHWKKRGGQMVSVDAKKSNGDYVVITLGRPITLEDVMVMMDKVLKEYAWEYLISPEGVFWRDWGEGRHEGTSKKWKLNTPLDRQEEITIDFLHELLVNR